MIYLAQQAADAVSGLPDWAGLLFGPVGVLAGAVAVGKWLLADRKAILADLKTSRAETKAANDYHRDYTDSLLRAQQGASDAE